MVPAKKMLLGNLKEIQLLKDLSKVIKSRFMLLHLIQI
jgi:hypothetical protein